MAWPDPVLAYELDLFAHSGLVVRRPSSGVLGFGLRVHFDVLELGAVFGPVWLRTLGGTGLVTSDGELPETVATALPGRALADLVSHPLVDGSRWPILAVDPPHGRGSVVRFACEPLPWRMPWARSSRAG